MDRSRGQSLITGMLKFLGKSIHWLLPSKEEEIICYHCGDKSRKSKTVYVRFDGEIRPVCCQGCAAILRTVEHLGIQEEYKASKTQAPSNSTHNTTHS